jgi:thymidine phosphorylase
MFTVKKISILNGRELVALMHIKDAQELSLHPKDKVKVICNVSKKSLICDLEIFDCDIHCNLTLKPGEIGLFEEAHVKLSCISKSKISIIPAPKPSSLEIVRKKFEEGRRISEVEFKLIIEEILENRYSDITKTFFVLACAAHALNDKEVIDLTKAMVNAGKVLDFKIKKTDIVVDKHCIGGIPNNRTTMIVIPIIAAAGLKIPKTSSRSITSPAGTADTMEVLANVEVPLSQMHSIVSKVNGCLVWGGGVDLSPADDIIIEVEHPLEIDSEGQMIASILSKKKCAGSTHVLIDIPIGKTAKISSHQKALHLKKRFEKVGKAIGLEILAIITNGDEPIGNGIGPAQEALDVLDVLGNVEHGPKDLREKSLQMAGIIFEMAKITKKDKGYSYAKDILDSGQALSKFNEIIDAQGRKVFSAKAKVVDKIVAKKSGTLKSLHNKFLSRTAFILGAPKTQNAGLRLHKKVGDKVKEGDIIMEVFGESKLKVKYAKTYVEEHSDIFEIK